MFGGKMKRECRCIVCCEASTIIFLYLDITKKAGNNIRRTRGFSFISSCSNITFKLKIENPFVFSYC